MVNCGSCGGENAEGSRFCQHCGHPFETRPARVERKVVTVLFADLVGFTARSDQADPEDVRALLQPFHAIARREIERYGGTLDKFMGDGALGVFGSPIAHEDDSERAVRAALAILDAIHSLNEQRGGEQLELRVGVNTGEAVVNMSAGVEEGENVAGDVVNTAARLQTAAPVGGVLVGEPTHVATRHAVRYEELPPVVAKGKAKQLRVWRALDVRPLATISERPATTPFVGRDVERTLMEEMFLRALRQSRLQALTIVGEPGAGKSRLVGELRAALPRLALHHDVQWRRGRCLPYGDGITFWALGEIVKDQAGILEANPPDERIRKLHALVDDLVNDPAERVWLQERLAPLIGIALGIAVDRDEAFTAWRRYLEESARARPLVAVVEDLHWADPAMVAFVEYLTEHPVEAPLLLVITARPELYDGHPTWGSGLPNAAVISLPPLLSKETSALISAFFPDGSLSPETRGALVARSGGNPFFAEELARSFRDRVGEEVGQTGLATAEFPRTVQSLIAARLDTLAPEQKDTVQDASVIGAVFWSGALAYVADDSEQNVIGHLHELSKKEMTHPVGVSSFPEQAQYMFWHALVRDVAYAQIPRASRATKHEKAAVWIDSVAGERAGDVAEILVHHGTMAMELARAAGDASDNVQLKAMIVRYLRLAAGRSMALDVGKAEVQLRQALSLTTPDHPDRARVQASLAEAAFLAGRLDEAQLLYAEAITDLRDRGEIREAAEAMVRRSVVVEYLGDSAEGRATLAEAIDLLSAIPPGPELARALATRAGSLMVAARYQDAALEADRAIELAERVGERAAAARAHGFGGYARAILGDPKGLGEQREALQDLLALGVGRATAIAYNNLGSALTNMESPQAGLDALRDGVTFAERRGLREMVMALRNAMVSALFELGEWDEVLKVGQEVVEEARRQGSVYDEVFAEADRATVLAYRTGEQAIELCEAILERARPLDDPPILIRAAIAAAVARLAAEERAGTTALVREILEATADDKVVLRMEALPTFVRLSVGGGDLDLAEQLMQGCGDQGVQRHRLSLLSAEATLAEAHGEIQEARAGYEAAAGGWARWGCPLEEAFARFGASRCMSRLGDMEEARTQLETGHAIFARLGVRVPPPAPSAILQLA